jgi:hypothetical protein
MPNRSTEGPAKAGHYDGPCWWWPIAAVAVLALLGFLADRFFL